MKRLLNKVVVVTGGNSGIGKGIAHFFWKEGGKVAIFGRTQESLDQARQEMNDEIITVQGDITKTEDIKKLYHQVLNRFGKIDVLIANSVVGERLHISDTTEEKFDYMVNINYRGVFMTVRYALDCLNDRASIILMSSCAATLNLKHHSIYASTKAAVTKLAKNFANDLASRGIRVNSISPGYIRTPIFDDRLEQDPEYLKRREQMIPLKRIGTPDDIAKAALFLASDDSSYVTGIDLIVDGGYCASFPEQ